VVGGFDTVERPPDASAPPRRPFWCCQRSLSPRDGYRTVIARKGPARPRRMPRKVREASIVVEVHGGSSPPERLQLPGWLADRPRRVAPHRCGRSLLRALSPVATLATLAVPIRLEALNFGEWAADTDVERQRQTCREAGTQSQRSWDDQDSSVAEPDVRSRGSRSQRRAPLASPASRHRPTQSSAGLEQVGRP